MKRIVLLVVALTACGTLPPPPAADALSKAVANVQTGYMAGRDAAEALCGVYPRVCPPLRLAEKSVEESISAAQEAVAAYRAGQKTLAEATAAVVDAIDATKAFLLLVEAAKRQAA
jgi:hypothetical protein